MERLRVGRSRKASCRVAGRGIEKLETGGHFSRPLPRRTSLWLSCLYESLTPEESGTLIEKIEVVYTPKHGSCLNMAECELSVLERQCLDTRSW